MARHGSQRASVAGIATGLRRALRVGVRPAQLRDCDDLLALSCVHEWASHSSDPDLLAFGLEAVLVDALNALGDGPYGRAAKLLLGVATDAKGRPLKVRRELAADELGVMRSTFRQNYEDDLVDDVAAEVYRIEHRLPGASTCED
jgi:hypothetical protein